MRLICSETTVLSGTGPFRGVEIQPLHGITAPVRGTPAPPADGSGPACGPASAPVVAAAFHPALAPVGVLLAVLGYALGTYGAWLTGQLMRLVSE